jgi:hypothetical protein
MRKKRIPKPALLRAATPYPWKRDYQGNLCGADGQPVYFRGADAMLVEHSPTMAEALVIIRALTESRRDPQRALNRITAVANSIITELEKRHHDPAWCRGRIS